MLAYRASTLAFSKMARWEGVVSLIFNTQRHLAKSAPSFLYCAQRSDSPSRPIQTQNHPLETQMYSFCELSGSIFLVLPTLGGGLSICSSEGHNTFINLKRGDRQKHLRNKTNRFESFSKNTPQRLFSQVCPYIWLCVHVNTPLLGLCIVPSRHQTTCDSITAC